MTPVNRKPDLIGIAGAGPYPVRPALTTKDGLPIRTAWD
jgi:hypothetical protein